MAWQRNHMFWIAIKRIIKSGVTNFRRNGVVSLASALIMTTTLSFIASLIFVQAIFKFSLNEIENKVDVNIYFTPEAPEEKILDLKRAMEALPEVSVITYTSSETSLANFRERHKNDYLVLQALDELDSNPLGASLNIKAKETSQYESIANFLSSGDGLVKDSSNIIEKINYNQNKVIIDRLISLTSAIKKLGIVLALVLVIVSILITFNTIRLTIFISREEIGVMRLVGATKRYIRGPFLIEGIVYGLIGSVSTMFIFWPVTYWLGKQMSSFFGLNLFDYYLSNFFQIFGLTLLFGVILGSISSFIAIRKYLNK